jgi:hypothetical protein
MGVSYRGLEGLRCKEPCGVVCEILKDRGAQLDFAVAFCDSLPHFKGGQLSQLALSFEQKLGGAGIIFARSSIGRAAQDTKALSAVARASIIS